VDQLADVFDGKAKVSKVDVDQCPDIAQRYGVMSIPTLMVINGGKVVSKAVGAQPGPKIAKMIEDELTK
jgi:thioredoxin 1